MNTKNVSNQSVAFTSRILKFFTFNPSSKNVQRTGYVLALAVLAVVLYFGQKLRVSWREQNAQYAYAQVQDFLIAQQKELGTTQLDAVIEKIDAAYYQNSSSYLAPYFLNLKADVLLSQGNREQALQILGDLINTVDYSMPGELVRTKHALLLLDAGNEQEGIAKLEGLATSTHNQVKDIAQFYLGRYYWVTGHEHKAKQIWQTLVEEQRVHRISPSPWAQQARQAIEPLT